MSKDFIGMIAPAELDAVLMYCCQCGRGKSWVSKEDAKLINEQKIVFICELCVMVYGTKLQPADITEVDHENELGWI
jgi:hypothetical protein